MKTCNIDVMNCTERTHRQTCCNFIGKHQNFQWLQVNVLSTCKTVFPNHRKWCPLGSSYRTSSHHPCHRKQSSNVRYPVGCRRIYHTNWSLGYTGIVAIKLPSFAARRSPSGWYMRSSVVMLDHHFIPGDRRQFSTLEEAVMHAVEKGTVSFTVDGFTFV